MHVSQNAPTAVHDGVGQKTLVHLQVLILPAYRGHKSIIVQRGYFR